MPTTPRRRNTEVHGTTATARARLTLAAVTGVLVGLLATTMVAPSHPSGASTPGASAPEADLSGAVRSGGVIEAPMSAVLRTGEVPAGPSLDAITVGRARAGAAAFVAPPNDDFALDFDSSVDAATRHVVRVAAGIWSSVLDADVPITVDVRMEATPPGVLGAAGPTTAHYGRSAFPASDVLYPVALANQFEGVDLEPGVADVDLVLSSTTTWDTDVSGNVAATGQSMLSVVIHEMGHGLGHTSWVRKTAQGWTSTFELQGTTLALGFDRLVGSADGTAITSVGPTRLASMVTTPLYWLGAKGVLANDGTPPALYSPSEFEPGSSIGHLDEADFGSAVMTPFLSLGESHTSIPAITSAMLADLGWSLETTADNTTSTTTGTAATGAARSEAFVNAVALDLLGRPATGTELATWRSHLQSGGSRDDVTRAFAFSDEWIGVLVDELYQSTLGRPAEPAGRAFWITVLRSGRTPADVAASFYASDEYVRRAGGTTQAWIGDLYREILGRDADAAGLAFWTKRSVLVPRDAVTYDFHQSLESRHDRVEALFLRLLGRGPDAGGWSHWAEVLGNGRDLDLAVVLAASDEYWDRAATRQ